MLPGGHLEHVVKADQFVGFSPRTNSLQEALS
jgi:hypothetical protein